MSVKPDRPIIFGALSAPPRRKPRAASILTRNAAVLKPGDLLFGPFLDRSEAGLPPDYLPDALGVQFAGPGMLKKAGCTSCAPRPGGWEKIGGKDVRYLGWHDQEVEGYDRLQVRQIERSKAWVVERVDSCTDEYQTLVFLDVAIVGQSRREAMFLAEFYRKEHALRLVGCGWRKPSCRRR